MAVVTIRRPSRRFACAAPNRARLFDSVPPDVNRISSSRASRSSAAACRAAVSSRSASKPIVCRDDGFP